MAGKILLYRRRVEKNVSLTEDNKTDTRTTNHGDDTFKSKSFNLKLARNFSLDLNFLQNFVQQLNSLFSLDSSNLLISFEFYGRGFS